MTDPKPILTRDQTEDRLVAEFNYSRDLLRNVPEARVRELLDLEEKDKADRTAREQKQADHKQKMRDLIDKAIDSKFGELK